MSQFLTFWTIIIIRWSLNSGGAIVALLEVLIIYILVLY